MPSAALGDGYFRAMSWVAAGCAIVVLVCVLQQSTFGGVSVRIVHSLPFLAGLIVLGLSYPATRLLPARPIFPHWTARLASVPGLDVALAVTGGVAAIGFVAIAILALYPPPLEASGYKAWEYLDKRWLVAAFLLGAGVVHLPGLVRRLIVPAGTITVSGTGRAQASVWRRLVMIGCAGALATLYLAPLLPTTIDRYLDMHDQVHLGALQRIAHGSRPYIDARTQYGPGHQIVTDAMMQGSGFTLRGFRISQALLNLATISLLFAMWLLAFGWRAGLAIIALSLAVSPIIIATFWGWGLLLRWLAPVLVGVIFPFILWQRRPPHVRYLVAGAVAAACGGLAWMAQENLSGALMAVMLVLSTAVVRKVTTPGGALMLVAVFAAVEGATFLGLMLASFGPGDLTQSLHLYFLSSGLVSQGMTNTAWSEPFSTFRRAYLATPLLLYAIMTIALYLPARKSLNNDEFHLAQIGGLAAAAVPLTMLTMLRADTPHFIGTSTALMPLLVLAFIHLPGHLDFRLGSANAVRVVMLAAFVLLYFNPAGNYSMRLSNDRTFSDPRRTGDLASTVQGLEILREGIVGPQRNVASADIVERKLGFVPAPNSACCHNAAWSFATYDWTLRRIHDATAGRSVFLDLAPPLETSGIYFLADLAPATPYVSRIMSIWTDDDIAAVAHELLRHPPGCIVSGPEGTLFTERLLHAYPHYGITTAIPGPLGITVHCMTDPDGATPRAAPMHSIAEP